MAVHVTYLTPTPVLNGVVINKGNATIAEMMKADTEMRVVPDQTNSNTTDSPTLETYLDRENQQGFLVKSVHNTMVITEK